MTQNHIETLKTSIYSPPKPQNTKYMIKFTKTSKFSKHRIFQNLKFKNSVFYADLYGIIYNVEGYIV